MSTRLRTASGGLGPVEELAASEWADCRWSKVKRHRAVRRTNLEGSVLIRRTPFIVTALGPVTNWWTPPDSAGPVAGSQSLGDLALLVAKGKLGASADQLVLHWQYSKSGAFDNEGDPGDQPLEGDKPYKSARTRISRLRKNLPDGAVVLRNGRYHLELENEDVDVWWLFDAAKRPLHHTDSERLVHVLRDEPFVGSDRTDMIRAAIDQVHLARRTLISKLGSTDRHLVDHELVGLANAILEENLHDSELADAVTQMQQALDQQHRDVGDKVGTMEPSDSPQEIEHHRSQATSDPPTGPRPTTLPRPMKAMLTRPYVGPGDSLIRLGDALTDPDWNWIVLAGPYGLGKDRACAEVCERLALQGVRILRSEIRRPSEQPLLDVFAAVLPEFQRFRDGLELDGADLNSSRRTHVYANLRQSLLKEAGTGPLVLVIGAAERLDGVSIGALSYLSAQPLPGHLTIVLIGDEDRIAGAGRAHRADGARWQQFVTDLVECYRGLSIDVSPLTSSEMADLIGSFYPSLPRHRTGRVATRLHEMSGGLPGLARALLPSLLMSTSSEPAPRLASPFAAVVDRLHPEARTVGAVLASFGHSVELGVLSSITGLDEDETLAAVDDLYNASLVDEVGEDRFRISSPLAIPVLTASQRPGVAQRWHREAAERYRTNVHRHADHLHEAGDVQRAVPALLESAKAYLDRGRFEEAVDDYERAAALEGSVPGPTDAVGYARALDLSGRPEDAAAVRAHAVAAAFAGCDHDLALDIAMSGVPEAEEIGHHLPLLEHLRQIDPQLLSSERSNRYARVFARQLSFAGAASELDGALSEARRVATTDDERLATAVTERYARSTTWSPAQCLQFLDRAADAATGASPATVAEYLVHRGMDAYEGGLTDEFVDSLDRLRSLVVEGPARQRWHQLLADGLLADDELRPVEAAELRREAAAVGLAAGITSAAAAHAAGEFGALWVAGDTEALLEAMAPSALSQPGAWPLQIAAASAVLCDLAGDHERAHKDCGKIVGEALRASNRHAVPSLALISDLVARSEDRDTRHAVYQLLGARGNVMVLLGAFVTSLGPVDRYRACLAQSESERQRCLESAEQLADQVGARRWIEVCRADAERSTP